MNFLLPEAEADIMASALYYQSQQPGLEEKFLEAIQDGLRRIQDHPEAWTLVGPSSLRRCLLRLFPYGIYYRVLEGDSFIIAVGHLSRKPGFWKKRL